MQCSLLLYYVYTLRGIQICSMSQSLVKVEFLNSDFHHVIWAWWLDKKADYRVFQWLVNCATFSSPCPTCFDWLITLRESRQYSGFCQLYTSLQSLDLGSGDAQLCVNNAAWRPCVVPLQCSEDISGLLCYIWHGMQFLHLFWSPTYCFKKCS